MLSANARFETASASRYLQQLCKHFAHKIAVDFDAQRGIAELPPGPATLRADDAGLDMTVTAADAEGLARGRFILEDHLRRFAFREEPAPLVWRDDAGGEIAFPALEGN